MHQFTRRGAGNEEYVGPLAVEVETQDGDIGLDAKLGMEPKLPVDKVDEGEVAVVASAAEAHSLVVVAVCKGEGVEV